MPRWRDESAHMHALRSGDRVVMIGGGPGGLGCALALQQGAAERSLELDIKVLEGKRFGRHYNQCAGVLSPPLTDILQREFGIELPRKFVHRIIEGYVLHTERQSLVLSGDEHGGSSLAVRRSEFDEFLESCARGRGIDIVGDRATDIEFRPDSVIVFTWGGTIRASAVVGAFGLSRAMTSTLAHRTAYRPPDALETVVSNYHPHGRGTETIPNLLDNHIHVLLPNLPRIEFGALIPKGNHITIIVAGRKLRTTDMDAFLELPPVRRLAPSHPRAEDYFKGRFPISLAQAPFGDRYVTVGDAAGLVRPFKGKGVNSALVTGRLAALTMLDHGVSRQAFTHFYRACDEITGDMWSGRVVRALAHLSAHHFSLDPVIDAARTDRRLRGLLFDCVSGASAYRRILLQRGNAALGLRLAGGMLAYKVGLRR